MSEKIEKKKISRCTFKTKGKCKTLAFWMWQCWNIWNVINFCHSKYNRNILFLDYFLYKVKKKPKCLNLLITFSAYRTAKQENEWNWI